MPHRTAAPLSARPAPAGVRTESGTVLAPADAEGFKARRGRCIDASRAPARRTGPATLAGMLLLPLACAEALAQAWPARPIRLIVPLAAGGTGDTLARDVAQAMEPLLGVPITVENRAGANGILGMELVAKAPADGYTVVMGGVGPVAINPSLYPKLPFNIERDFTAIVQVADTTSVLVVPAALPVKTVKDLIALAKKRPGSIIYSSSGVGGFPHMSTELFKLMAGVNLVHVPFRGGGPAIADTAAGNTQLQLGSIPTVIGQVRAKRLKAIAVGGPKPHPSLPGLPTISESGVPGYQSQIWFGVFAPRATPQAIISGMHGGVGAALDAPDTVKRLNEQGVDINKMSSAEFAKLMASEQDKWAKVIRAANITGE